MTLTSSHDLPTPSSTFTMVHKNTRVVYKPDSQSTDEFVAIINPDEYKKWKEGDTTIPLAEVVDSFDIFFSNQGHQGLLGKASKQQLENAFGTSNDMGAMEELLKRGTEQTGKGFMSGITSQNDSHGSKVIDTKGGRSTSGV